MEKDYNLDFRSNIPNARGTIHPTAISRGFSLPLAPTNYKEVKRKKWQLNLQLKNYSK